LEQIPFIQRITIPALLLVNGWFLHICAAGFCKLFQA
jgi:hypothetical protein